MSTSEEKLGDYQSRNTSLGPYMSVLHLKEFLIYFSLKLLSDNLTKLLAC